jgi:hypothetical protein
MTTPPIQTLSDELLGEIEADGCLATQDECVRLITELRTVRAENAELRKDAGRYRWLRDDALKLEVSAPAIMVVDMAGHPVYRGDPWNSLLCDSDADTAIDAAMQAKP